MNKTDVFPSDIARSKESIVEVNIMEILLIFFIPAMSIKLEIKEELCPTSKEPLEFSLFKVGFISGTFLRSMVAWSNIRERTIEIRSRPDVLIGCSQKWFIDISTSVLLLILICCSRISLD